MGRKGIYGLVIDPAPPPGICYRSLGRICLFLWKLTLATQAATWPGLLEPLGASRVDLRGFPLEKFPRCHVADGTVQSHMIVVATHLVMMARAASRWSGYLRAGASSSRLRKKRSCLPLDCG